MSQKFCIEKHIEDVILNPLETLLNPNGSVMEFDSVDEAVKYLNDIAAASNQVQANAFAKYTAETWQDDGIFINPIVNVLSKAYCPTCDKEITLCNGYCCQCNTPIKL